MKIKRQTAGTREKAGESVMEKIYIIEDDENIRNLLKIALEGFGYEAEEIGRAHV